VHWLVQALLLYLQTIATSKETDLHIAAEKSLEVLLLVLWVLKCLPVHEARIAKVTMMMEAVRDQAADILTESSRLALLLPRLVLLPRLPPNMFPIAKQMPQRPAEAVHELEASPDVVIRMMMISMMKTAVEEAEADMLIPSIVLHKWQKLELLPPL
jgi:hypothetical protein